MNSPAACVASVTCAIDHGELKMALARGGETRASVHDAVTSPAPSPIQIWHVSRAAHAQNGPCGDRVLVLPLRSGRTAIAILDVAAHGSARGPLSAAVADAITSSLLRDGSPAAALGCADGKLRASDDELPYAVAFIAVMHPVWRTVVYASAGHDCAFALADDGLVRHLAPTAPMLGIPLRVDACDAISPLGRNETLVIATDGIVDSRPAGSADFFGAPGAARAVARSLHVGGDPAQDLLEAACAHGGDDQVDDIGVVVARPTTAPTRALRHNAATHGRPIAFNKYGSKAHVMA